jgi:heme-degrading monooxygenase HmoA
MIAVIFEVMPTDEGKTEYLAIAASLKEHLTSIPGFISIERFQSLADPSKLLSLSFWEDETSVSQWRNLEEHRIAQAKGRGSLFSDYRIRVGSITRDYSLSERDHAPKDSIGAHANSNNSIK